MSTLTKRAFVLGTAAAGAAVSMPSVLRAQATVLRWGEMLPITHPQVQMVERIARQVKEKTWELHQLFNQQVPFVPLWHLDRHIVLANSVDVYFDGSIRPVQPSQLDPTRLFTCIERWRLK